MHGHHIQRGHALIMGTQVQESLAGMGQTICDLSHQVKVHLLNPKSCQPGSTSAYFTGSKLKMKVEENHIIHTNGI